MKVYIATCGVYSSYRIQRVFLNKEKAEKYVSLQPCNADCMVEEYDITESEPEEVKYCTIQYTIRDDTQPLYEFKICTTSNMDINMERINSTQYWSTNSRLWLLREISQKNYDEEKLYNKYLKVCQDLYAQIKYHQSMGWDDKMIREWLKGVK